MPADGASARLTVCFDGQFWIGLFEREDDDGLAVARHVFGPEPSLPQIAELVAGPSWSRLRFVLVTASEPRSRRQVANPKRRQREAAREARAVAPSTKSQEALKAALDEQKVETVAVTRERREAAAEERWQQRAAKHKEKKRGH